jgi:trk system potassium uptake protein TrkH
MLNKKFIFHILGILLVVESFFLFLSAAVAYYYHDPDFPAFITSGSIAFIVGAMGFLLTRKCQRIVHKREGYIIVCLVWIVFAAFGCLPYVFSHHVPEFTDAFFETLSGFTTTGISIFTDVESLPHGLLFWRATTQWIGGMGIIVLSLAILPFLNIGGMQLFAAEVPGITYIKLTPKLNGTAIRLWLIYVFFTVLEAILLKLSGMDTFDAVCHALSTMATGGFSTKNDNIAHYSSPQIQYIIIAFMFLSGINFTILYYAITIQFTKLRRNEEFFYYTIFILLFSFIVFVSLLQLSKPLEETIRVALFNTVSIITTTGFVTTDFQFWPLIAINLIFVMLFIGGSTGSTGGGLKVIRVVVIIKNVYYELRRIVHPRAVIPLRINKKSVSNAIVSNILIFVTVYILIFAFGAIVLTFIGLDFETAIGAALTSISNAGPGFGKVSSPMSYASFPDSAKWVLSVLMLVGRLEIFTVLALITPQFWKK